MPLVKRHPLLAILAVALVLRLVAACVVTLTVSHANRDFFIPGDAEGYWLLAGQILAGEDYAIYDPPRRVMRMPGFPALLAVCRGLTDDSLFGTRLLLAGVGTAGCAAVFLLGRTLVSNRVGLIGSFLAAIHPVFIGFSVLVLSETLFALGLTLSLAIMATIVRHRSDFKNIAISTPNPALSQDLLLGALTGLLIALACYVRPTWLPAAILFPVALVIAQRSRRAVLTGAAVVLATALSLLPWAWRNHTVTGHWVVTTLWVGPSLYDGLHPGATGASDMRFFDEELLLERMSEYEMDQAYRARAWEFARENPRRVLKLAAVKLWRYWRPWPGAEQFSNWPAHVTVAIAYVPLIALAIVGAWARRGDPWVIGLTVLPIVLFSIVHCVFVSSLRYRLPVEYPLCVLSATGLRWILQYRNSRVI